MKRKHLFLASVAIAALLAAGGFWFASASRDSGHSASGKLGAADFQTLDGPSNPGQTNNPRPRLAPPEPTRRFRDFTPEQRVQQARKGHGPGG